MAGISPSPTIGQLNNKNAYLRKTMQIEMQTNMKHWMYCWWSLRTYINHLVLLVKKCLPLKESMNFDSFDDWKYFKTNVYELTEDDVFFLNVLVLIIYQVIVFFLVQCKVFIVGQVIVLFQVRVQSSKSSFTISSSLGFRIRPSLT